MLGTSAPAWATWSPAVPPVDTAPAVEGSAEGNATNQAADASPAEGHTAEEPRPAASPLIPVSQLDAPAPEGTAAEPPRETFISLPPRPAGLGPRRSKPLKMTVGVPPTTGDLGSEADTLTPTTGPPVDENAGQVRLNDTWSFVLKGYLRADANRVRHAR
jgi:hypothetical protein